MGRVRSSLPVPGSPFQLCTLSWAPSACSAALALSIFLWLQKLCGHCSLTPTCRTQHDESSSGPWLCGAGHQFLGPETSPPIPHTARRW